MGAAGIRHRNLAEPSALHSLLKYGWDMLMPPPDEEFILPSTPIAYNTAAGALTLATSFTGQFGNLLPWPQRIKLVMRNRAADTAGAPGIPQCSPTLAGSNGFTLRVTGSLAGVPQTETLFFQAGNSGTISGMQRQHRDTVLFYDKVTAIELVSTVDANASTWGSSVALQVCAGLVNCTLGDAPSTTAVTATDGSTNHTKAQMVAPFNPGNPGLLQRLIYLDEGLGAQAGESNQGRVFIARAGAPANQPLLLMPCRAPLRWTLLGLGTVDTGADNITLAAHGLKLGDVVRLGPNPTLADGMPGNTVEGTNYYLAGTVATDTFQLKATANDLNITAGSVLDLTAAGAFANGEAVRVWRPVREFRPVRLLFTDGAKAEG